MFFIIVKLNEYAAIAQSVERILGKDEVASSNLAISSISPSQMKGFLLYNGAYLHDFSARYAFSMNSLLKNVVLSKKLSIFLPGQCSKSLMA